MEDFIDGVEGNMASRMRKVYSEQFLTLVRMHLSFVLDLNTEENDTVTEKAKLKKWSLLNFSKKPKSTGSLQKEGEEVALTKQSINQLKQLIEYLSKDERIKQEGIFRLTGNLNRRQALKDALYKNLPLNLEEGRYTVHDVASVLKTFLQDLPEPLLTEAHHPIHVQIAEFCSSNNSPDGERLLRSLQLLLLLLPPQNRTVLKYVLGLLNKTAAHENSNKMNCDTLATVMTPSLICPRNQAEHELLKNSQQFSGLVSFMIKKGTELFKIPPKLFTDIRVFWVEQEKKLLSPQPIDVNEANADQTGTAHTVFSFVDRNATAKATAASDTQAALAQLYAHIQAMPESAKKRKLVKQFNKENGQGTPRHINQNSSGKSFGDSIKKRIFQKKLHKKINDVKLGCNFSRSSSEENMVSNTSSLIPKMFSKSEDELSDMESYDVHQQENLTTVKHISNSTGSINTPCPSYKKKGKVILKNFLNISERSATSSPNDSKKRKNAKSRFSRHRSEPPDMYSSQTAVKDAELMRQSSESTLTARRRSSLGKKSPERTSPQENSVSIVSDYKSSGENPVLLLSPATKNKLRCLYAAHTSTPSNLLRQSLANDYILTPITDDDKSMSPITQSATKMTKAMQETMMTPRSRKPVVMVSASNLCGLATLHNGSMQYDSTNSLQSNYDIINRRNYTSIMEESPSVSMDYTCKNSLENKENFKRVEDIPEEQSFVTCVDEMCGSTIQKSTALSVTNTYVYPSRSVLTASPVDLSFTSRTGDFEQSESDLIIPAEEGNNPGSDTSGIASGSTNSANNSAEKIDEGFTLSPRKRCASLQRNDSKRSFKDESICDRVKTLKQKQLSESTLNSVKIKDPLPETSF